MSEEETHEEKEVPEVSSDGYTKIEEEFEDDTPVFAFENDNDFVEGVYEKVDSDVGENNSKMYTLKLEDESLVKVWGSYVLDSKMQKIEVGKQVKIQFTGKKSSAKSGRKYKTFEVYFK